MAARQASVHSELYGKDISRLWPISYEGQSDTACFDNALEFLVQGGYSLPHAVMMMIPEAWAGNPLMDEQRRAFYEYHAALMEPWDGPAAIAFTDGRQIGATLDRNGLAAGALSRHQRRPHRDGVRNGRAEDSGGPDRHQVAAAARQDAAGRPRTGPPHSRRRDQGGARQEPSLQRLAAPHPDRARGTAGRADQGRTLQPAAARSAAGVRLFAGRHHHPDDADGLHRRGSDGLDGQRHADLGAVGPAEAALHLLQAELCAGDEPADRPDPRGARDEPRLDHRAAAEPVRPARASPRPSGSKCASRS